MSSRTPFSAITALLFMSAAVAGDAVKIGDGKQPQLAVDPAGVIHVVFGKEKDIFHSASTDGGKTYSAPALVANAPNLPLGMRRGPRIAATAKSVVVTAISGQLGGGKDGDVVCWRSTDGGKTWTAGAKPLNSVSGAAREGLHGMAAGPGEQLFCAWLDLREGKTQIWGAGSKDGGATWSADALIYKSPGGGTCPCCHPSVAIEGNGAVHVMFRNDLNGEKDMYLSSSTDEKSFSPAIKLGTGSWPLAACPMEGGGVAVTSGKLTTVWKRDKKLYVARVAGEAEIAAGVQPVIAGGADGPYVAWLSRRGGDLMLRRPSGNTAIKVAADASDPSISGGIDNKGPVVIAWESVDGVKVTTLKPR